MSPSTRTSAAGLRPELSRSLNQPGPGLSSSFVDVTDKSPSGNLGRMGETRDIDYNSLYCLVLRGQYCRFSHQLHPMNVDRRSILSVTSRLANLGGELGFPPVFWVKSL